MVTKFVLEACATSKPQTPNSAVGQDLKSFWSLMNLFFKVNFSIFSLFYYMYCASFIILYNDHQMHN